MRDNDTSNIAQQCTTLPVNSTHVTSSRDPNWPGVSSIDREGLHKSHSDWHLERWKEHLVLLMCGRHYKRFGPELSA